MIYENYPMYDIDVEKGTIYSYITNKYIGHINKRGYVQTTINNKHYRVHRLIWECVNGEIPEGYDIHHIDGNKLNNSIYNLDIIKNSEHTIKHHLGQKRSNVTKNKIKAKVKTRKPVLQYDLNGNVIKQWGSARETKIEGFDSSHIRRCCNGMNKTHKGFIWKYLNEEKDVA